MRRWSWAAVLVLAWVGLPADAQGEPGPGQGQGGPHAPILVDGDGGFLAFDSGVVRGWGTPEHPYVIEGWTIDVRGDPDAPGIHIRDTAAHALVQDCLVLKDKPGKGIHVQKAKNVRVERCKVQVPSVSSDVPPASASATADPATDTATSTATDTPQDAATASPTATGGFDDAGEAIHVEDSEQVAVDNVTLVYEGDPRGGGTLLLLQNVTGAAVTGNTVAGSPGDGIRVAGGSDVTLVGNTVTASGGAGIVVQSVGAAEASPTGTAATGAPAVAIAGNNVTGNQDDGIRAEDVPQVAAAGNSVTSNGGDGIEVAGAKEAAVTGNTVSGNEGDGIEVAQADEATVSNNTVSGNEGAGVAVDVQGHGGDGGGGGGSGDSGEGGNGGQDGQDGTAVVSGNTVEGNAGGGIVVEGPATVSGNILAGNAQYAVAIVTDDPRTVVEGNEASGSGEATAILAPPGPTVGDNDGATFVVTEAGFDPRGGGGGDGGAPVGEEGLLWAFLAFSAFLATAYVLMRRQRRSR